MQLIGQNKFVRHFPYMDDSKVYEFVKPNNQISKLFERNSKGDYNLPIIDCAGNDL